MFSVTVAVKQSPAGLRSATVEKDFTVGRVDAVQRLTFLPYRQVVHVPFQLLNDAIPESTEAFKFTVSRDTTIEGSPSFDCNPDEGCPETTVIKITDIDRK